MGNLTSVAGVAGVIWDDGVLVSVGAVVCVAHAAVREAVVPSTRSLDLRCRALGGLPNVTAVVKRVTQVLMASPSANMWASAPTDWMRMWSR